MSRNDITGDSIRSKPLSKEAEDNWDRIFGKKDKTQDPITKPFPHNILKQSRIDTIGSNGNEGLHYEYELDKSTGEVKKVSRIDIIGQNGPTGEHYDE
jgi:hypothetical protein